MCLQLNNLAHRLCDFSQPLVCLGFFMQPTCNEQCPTTPTFTQLTDAIGWAGPTVL